MRRGGGGGGGTLVYELSGDLSLDREWFLSSLS